MSNVITRYNAPLLNTFGPDGVPNYISAQVGDPIRWKPPAGKQLRVYCNGRELFFVVECDRERGWARTLPWETGKDGRPRAVEKKAGDGTPILREYLGRIEYRLVPAYVPRWLRKLARRIIQPNEAR